MNILITGAAGMLGRTLCKMLSGHRIVALKHSQLDITEQKAVWELIEKVQPDVLINCAALTNVDLCETEKELAYKINALGVGNLARACNYFGVRLIAISTDYVFDGEKKDGYSEDDKATGGATIYGKSKLLGEELVQTYCPNHVILRLAWLYGYGGPSFLHTMVGLAKEKSKDLIVVDDQFGNPTSTDAVARVILEILNRLDVIGIMHVSCEGKVSRYEYAKEIYTLLSIENKLQPCKTKDYKRLAIRPKNTCLIKDRIRFWGLTPLVHWKEELRNYLSRTDEF